MAIPLYILSGFLGCGKTTFLCNLISHFEGKKILVIENEVAELGIDARISTYGNVEMVEINDGSISTVNLGNFRRVLHYAKKKKPDIVIVETSGAADLAPLLSVIDKAFVPYGICVVDAKRFFHAKKLSTYTLNHIRHASFVVVNKTDLLDPTTTTKLVSNLSKLHTHVHTAQFGTIDFEDVLHSIQPMKTTKSTPFTIPHLFWKIKSNLGIRSSGDLHNDISACVYERYGSVDTEKLQTFLQHHHVPRAKGFIYKGSLLYYFNYVPGNFQIEQAPLQKSHRNRIVLIGDQYFSKRHYYRRELRSCMKVTARSFLWNCYLFLRNQQNIPARVVYL